jgi:hypothetical protein
MKNQTSTIELGKHEHITKPGKMTILSNAGKMIFITDMFRLDSELELGKVYSFNSDFDGNMWLNPAPSLDLPAKVYDFEQDFRNQILTTLRHKGSNMNIGVLLEGYKGQGKSVIAKQLAIESGLPIVLINSKIALTANFNHFLSCIKQDYVLLIDEFEKLFHNEDNNSDKDKDHHGQNSFLSLFDGVNGLHNKRLVILTSNKEIGDKFINRPSRIRYYKKFNFMNKKIFNAILKDKLKKKKYAKDLEDHLDIPTCTIDILTTIIDEINIQDKPYSVFMNFFNRIEKEITYQVDRFDTDKQKWVEDEDVRTKKELGIDAEYFTSIFGYNARLIKHDDDNVFYEDTEREYDDDGNFVKIKKIQYRAKRQKWITTRSNSVVL